MTQIQTVGSWHDVAIEIAGWDGVAASVDLSCACMFAHEAHGGTLTGGLAHLDGVLGGVLQTLRGEALFTAQRGESLLITRPPPGVAGKELLVVGLGDPQDWSPAVMEAAVRQALDTAAARSLRNVAFAASMLDGGLSSGETTGAASAMLRGLTRGIDAAARLQALGLAGPLSLERWIFDVGIARFDAAAHQFRAELTALSTMTGSNHA